MLSSSSSATCYRAVRQGVQRLQTLLGHFQGAKLLQTSRAASVTPSTHRAVTTAAASAASIAPSTAAMEVVRLPVLSDNYVWLLHEPTSKQTAVVDPAVHAPVLQALQERGWQLNYILNTHHHGDHTGGNLALKSKTGCTIVGPKADEARIPGIDVRLADGDVFSFGALHWQVFDVPGHTRGHIAYYSPQAKALLAGDTLFALGCGRVFEGTHQQMWHSLSKLAALPADTTVYCAHEYTQSNARFAVTVDPHNEALQLRKQRVDELRSQGQPTVPSQLGEELATNPFLRAADPGLRQQLGLGADAPNWQVFSAVRKAKDSF